MEGCSSVQSIRPCVKFLWAAELLLPLLVQRWSARCTTLLRVKVGWWSAQLDVELSPPALILWTTIKIRMQRRWNELLLIIRDPITAHAYQYITWYTSLTLRIMRMAQVTRLLDPLYHPSLSETLSRSYYAINSVPHDTCHKLPRLSATLLGYIHQISMSAFNIRIRIVGG